MKTANEDLFNLSVAHTNNVFRYSNNITQEILNIYEKSESEQRAYIYEHIDEVEDSRTKQRALVSALLMIEKKYSKQYTDKWLEMLSELNKNEIEYNHNTLKKIVNKGGLNRKLKPSKIEVSDIDKEIKKRPIVLDGGLAFAMTDFIDSLYRSRSNVIKQGINGSFVNEEFSPKKAVEKIYGKKSVNGKPITIFNRGGLLKRTRKQLKSNIDTVSNYVSNIVRNLTSLKNPEIISGYQLVAVLDRRTTTICLNLDGKVWYWGHPELSTLTSPEMPPFHHNCRTTISPIINKSLSNGTTSKDTKDYVDGGEVGRMTGEEWFEKQSKLTKKEILGAGRYYMYEKGNVKLSDLITKDNQILTIEQLKEADKLMVKNT